MHDSVQPQWFSYFMTNVLRVAEMLDLPFVWPNPDPVIQLIDENGQRQTGDEQPYTYRLTRLGTLAAEQGKGIEFADAVSSLIWGGTKNRNEGEHLANAVAVFEHSYAGNATCAPSRAMIMTGRYPTRTGFEFTPTPSGMGPVVSLISNSMDSGLPPARFNEAVAESTPAYEEQGLPSSEVTIAELLKARGYYTAHIGKWHLGRGDGFTPNDQGFDDSLLMASGLFLPEDDPGVVNAKLDFDPIDQFLWARLGFAASFNNGGSERFEPGGYLTNFEGGLRVPMFIKWPSRIAPGTKVQQPVAHIDVMPTLAAAASASLPENVPIDGVDLLPLATGAGDAWDRKTLFWQSGYYRVVRHGEWKLQVSEKPKKAWLYHLGDDPTEQNNLAASATDKLAELQALLAAHKASAVKPLYPYVAEFPVGVDKSLAEPFEVGDEYIYWPN